MSIRIGKRIARHPDGSVEHETWKGYSTTFGWYEQPNGRCKFTRYSRALCVMSSMERRGRTESRYYKIAQEIALEKWTGAGA